MTQIFRLINNELVSIPFFDLEISLTYDKAGIADFKSNTSLTEGEEIRITGNDHPNFGGIINSYKYNTDNAYYDYECIDYTSLLFKNRENFSTKNGQTSYHIIKKLIGDIINTGGVKKGKTKHPYLVFKDKNSWDIIQQLRWLDWKKGEKNIAYVDMNGVLHYKPYEKDTYHYLSNVYNYNHDYTKDEKRVSEDFFKKYKNIYHEKVIQKNSSKPKDTSKIINLLLEGLSSRKGYKWSKSSDYNSIIRYKKGNSVAMSEYIYKSLKNKGVIVRIILTRKSKEDHHLIQYKLTKKEKWVNLSYKGFDNRFKNNKFKIVKVIKSSI